MIKLQLCDLPAKFDKCLDVWHKDPEANDMNDVELDPLVRELVFRNCLLWHEEDKARRTDVDDGTIAAVKRRIDVLNQQRNNQIEKIDEYLMQWLAINSPQNSANEINSETPGSIVDRLSILSLKIFHMHEDTLRTDISAEHRERSANRLAILREQRCDLNGALLKLLDDLATGRKMMKIYRQFKMYNDPTLNPEIYKQAGKNG
jgi:hypothetical protein